MALVTFMVIWSTSITILKHKHLIEAALPSSWSLILRISLKSNWLVCTLAVCYCSNHSIFCRNWSTCSAVSYTNSLCMITLALCLMYKRDSNHITSVPNSMYRVKLLLPIMQVIICVTNRVYLRLGCLSNN